LVALYADSDSMGASLCAAKFLLISFFYQWERRSAP